MNEMQYFVSIENNAYCRWQAELLIESFKYHNLTDQLVVAISHNDQPDISKYSKNLLAHDRKFVYANFGKEFKSFNKTRSLIWALEQRLLKKPFVLLHPDMLLLKPIETRKESFVYDVNTEHLNELKETLSDRVKKIIREQQGDWFSWLPLGDTMIFNKDISDLFFTKLHLELEFLVKKFGADSKLKLEKAAWWLTIYREIIFKENELSVTGDLLEQDFNAHNIFRNIIHYKHGIAEFHKCNYTYRPPDFLALDKFDPIDSMYENNFTTSTNFAYNLIERYRNS